MFSEVGHESLLDQIAKKKVIEKKKIIRLCNLLEFTEKMLDTGKLLACNYFIRN